MDKIDFALLASINYKTDFTLGWVFVCSYSCPVLRFRQFWFLQVLYLLTQSLWVPVVTGRHCIPGFIQLLWLFQSFYFLLLLTKKLFAMDIFNEMENLFLQWNVSEHISHIPRDMLKIDVYLCVCAGEVALFCMRVWDTEPNLVDSKYIKIFFNRMLGANSLFFVYKTTNNYQYLLK